MKFEIAQQLPRKTKIIEILGVSICSDENINELLGNIVRFEKAAFNGDFGGDPKIEICHASNHSENSSQRSNMVSIQPSKKAVKRIQNIFLEFEK